MEGRYTQRLADDFYQRSTVEVARALLGKILVHEGAAGVTAGRIVEVEAYLFHNDAACHAARGQTARNAPMFGPPGTAYVYLIYGIHYCFNVVTGAEGEGEAVLVRALEPLVGLEIMAERRGTAAINKVAAGPGNLCRAMAITKEHNGHNLHDPPLYLADDGYVVSELVTTTRVGISAAADLPLRFYIAHNTFISRK
jgi:DNA-3-methyladenine glycosylase